MAVKKKERDNSALLMEAMSMQDFSPASKHYNPKVDKEPQEPEISFGQGTVSNPLRIAEGTYQERFLRPTDMEKLKALVVSAETHQKLMTIFQSIRTGDVLFREYIENIMLDHLSLHREEIARLYRSKAKDLF